MKSCCGTTPAPVTDQHRMQLRYLGGRPVEVIGPATGSVYRFSGTMPLQLVDPRDAIQLNRSRGIFRVERIVKLTGEISQGESHG